MTDNFVGFARSPKQSKTAKLQSLQSELRSSLPISEAVALISTSTGVSRWLAELVTPPAKWRFQLGAKLRFSDELGEFGATFGAINLPGEVVLLTERFGEVRLAFGGPGPRRSWFVKSKPTDEAYNMLRIEVTRMCEPAEVADWHISVGRLMERLQAIVANGTDDTEATGQSE